MAALLTANTIGYGAKGVSAAAVCVDGEPSAADVLLRRLRCGRVSWASG